MALGAGRGAIFREVVLHGLTIAVAGVVIGEVLAIPAIRALASVQAGIRPAASFYCTSRRLSSGWRSPSWPATCPPVARRAWIPWKPCGTSDVAFRQLGAAGNWLTTDDPRLSSKIQSG